MRRPNPYPLLFCSLFALLGQASGASGQAPASPSAAAPPPSVGATSAGSARVPARPNPPAAARNQIRLPIWVEQEEDSLWKDGQARDFQVFLNDKEAPIRSFHRPDGPSILLVVLDTIADLARVEEAKTVLIEGLEKLPENYWVGLLRAQNGLSVLQEPTADRRVVAEKIRAISLGGKAGLLDVLEMVSTMATEVSKKARVRIQALYLTDGGIGDYRADYLNPVVNASDSGDLSRRFSDRAVRERMDRQAEALQRFTVPTSVVHLNYYSDPLNLAYMSGLEKISGDSGGTSAFCRSQEEIRPALQKALERYQAGYQVTVDEPARLRQALKVRITWKNPDSAAGRRILFPDTVVPAQPPRKNQKS